MREVTRRRGVGQYLLEEVFVTILAFHAGGWRMQAWKIAGDDSVYAGTGIYGTTGRLGER